MKKSVKVLMAAGVISLAAAVTSFAGDWKSDGSGTWYENDDGSFLKGNIYEVDGTRYFFDDNGYMRTGWQKLPHFTQWYFFDPATGAQQMGWFQDGGKYYYLDPAQGGAMTQGWLQKDGTWYYMDPAQGGAMATGVFYVVNDDGVEYAYEARNDGSLIVNDIVTSGEKAFRYLEDGVMMYYSGDSKRAGFNDQGWRYYKRGEEQSNQKSADERFVNERAEEMQDELYSKYRKSMETSNASRKAAKKSAWEALAKNKLNGYLTEEEIRSFISKVESGLYKPSTEVDDPDWDEDDWDD